MTPLQPIQTQPTESGELLKTDVLGRVKVKPEQREKLLDIFEASGMSAQAFAVQHGIIPSTFATWIQKRRRNRGDYQDETIRRKLRMPGKSKAQQAQTKSSRSHALSLVEVKMSHDKDSSAQLPPPHQSPPPLEVSLPGGAAVKVSSESQISLLKTLIRELSC